MRRPSPVTSNPRNTETCRDSNSTRLLNRVLSVSTMRPLRIGPARPATTSTTITNIPKTIAAAVPALTQPLRVPLTVPMLSYLRPVRSTRTGWRQRKHRHVFSVSQGGVVN